MGRQDRMIFSDPRGAAGGVVDGGEGRRGGPSADVVPLVGGNGGSALLAEVP